MSAKVSSMQKNIYFVPYFTITRQDLINLKDFKKNANITNTDILSLLFNKEKFSQLISKKLKKTTEGKPEGDLFYDPNNSNSKYKKNIISNVELIKKLLFSKDEVITIHNRPYIIRSAELMKNPGDDTEIDPDIDPVTNYIRIKGKDNWTKYDTYIINIKLVVIIDDKTKKKIPF